MRNLIVLALLGLVAPAAAQSSRSLEDLNWMEVRELVPGRIATVLLPAGILEAHGVVNNGADNLVPESLATRLAPRINGLIAPTIKYGVMGSLDEFPGTFGISASVFEAYAYEVLRGLAGLGFRNVIVLNGHGPNGDPLRAAAKRVFEDADVRILVMEWWTMTADLVEQIWGETGGHAGNNETAAVLAIRPDLVHPERFTGADMATARPEGWTAFPFPSSILLYRAGQGLPDFDRARARRYFDGTVDRLATVIRDVVAKWDRAGL